MENSNNFQGKTPNQYSNSAKFAAYGIAFMIVTLILVTLLKRTTFFLSFLRMILKQLLFQHIQKLDKSRKSF